MKDDRHWMQAALEQARQAAREDEVPVGAVLVRGGQVIGAGFNRAESTGNPLEHAETIAIREALNAEGRFALQESTMYVTLEPCTMCIGAALLVRIPRLVFGAREPNTGACESIFSIPNEPGLEHRMVVVGGIEAPSCSRILQDFFKQRRAKDDII